MVIVSAMGHSTDELIRLSSEVSPHHHPREMDMLLTAGERISMALLAMAIRDEGIEAMSLTGSQAGILTDTSHGHAKIREIKPSRVVEALDAGKVVIVAGFQGVSHDTKEITTLGRGGSDATAVAMAAALGADSCEIYTDVDGVFTSDPRAVHDARKLDEVSYDEMLEMAGAGARVLMPRSVEFGKRFNVPIHVRSSFHDRPGTWVKEDVMEEAIVSGVIHDVSEAKITMRGVPDTPGAAAAVFVPLADAGISVDIIVQNVSSGGVVDISFTIPRELVVQASAIAREVADTIGAAGVDVDGAIGRVSIVGSGMRSYPGVAAKMFSVLADADIRIAMISTSAIRVSCVIAESAVEEAVKLLHAAFQPPMTEMAS